MNNVRRDIGTRLPVLRSTDHASYLPVDSSEQRQEMSPQRLSHIRDFAGCDNSRINF